MVFTTQCGNMQMHRSLVSNQKALKIHHLKSRHSLVRNVKRRNTKLQVRKCCVEKEEIQSCESKKYKVAGQKKYKVAGQPEKNAQCVEKNVDSLVCNLSGMCVIRFFKNIKSEETEEHIAL